LCCMWVLMSAQESRDINIISARHHRHFPPVPRQLNRVPYTTRMHHYSATTAHDAQPTPVNSIIAFPVPVCLHQDPSRINGNSSMWRVFADFVSLVSLASILAFARPTR
jgi:hypothetical protein